jgi:phosphatidylglycerophosphatase A
MKRFIVLLLASNFGLGYAPVASGTFGTLAGIPVFYLMADLAPGQFALVWLILLGLSFWAADQAGRYYGVVDDGRIVIDELVGYLVAVAWLPFSWTTAGLGFLLFRLFDITKPPPVSWFDRQLKNGFGVVLDDVAAGIYAAIVLHLLLWVFS